VPTPTPPIYLIREQVDAICQSDAFDGQDRLKELLRFIVEQTIAEMETTEGILAIEVWRENSPDKTKVRANVGRLRKALSDYYESQDALTAIVLIAIPPAGLDATTRQFKHYSASIEFHAGMLRSAAIFAQVLFNKYGLPLSDGECWFTDGTQPVDLLRAVIRQHKANALLLGDLYYSSIEEARERMFLDTVHCYEIAEKILNSISPKPAKRTIHIQLVVPYVSEMVHCADTLAAYYTQLIRGRLVITPEIQNTCERAFAAVFKQFDHFLDEVEARLLPATKQSGQKEP
jgi:hypothetical protein